MEIVSGDNQKLQSVKKYDSLNFKYNDQTVSSLNWMGALPGSLRITDISIPGTHDAGTCWLESDQGHSSDQRYYINELLNAGVRHLDLRTGLNSEKKIRVIHASHECLNPDGDELSLDETMGWITDFLDANPTETVILQVMMDREGTECEEKTYKYLENMALKENSYIWAGDHVPTLEEARGKIIVISRLDLNALGGDAAGYNFKTTVDGKPALWGLDCNDWKKSKDYATDRVTSSQKNLECEVWTQDDYGHSGSTKKKYIKASLLGSASIGEGPADNKTIDRYNDAKKAGKHAWVFDYTSTSNGQKNPPFDICKEIHQWLYDRSEYDNSDRLVCGDTFTGVMCFDFIDELMASFIYKTNFGRTELGNKYVTIHGMGQDGKEVGKPLTLCVGESEQSSKLLNDTTDKIIKAYFNKAPYAMMTADKTEDNDNGDVLTDVFTPVQTQKELNDAAASARRTLEGSVPENLYVHLQTPIKEIDLDVNMPKCGTEVSADVPVVSVNSGSDSKCEAYITKGSDSKEAFEGTVNGGEARPVHVSIVPEWGFRFDNSCTVSSGSSVVAGSTVSGGKIEAMLSAVIAHDTVSVDETPASCTENGAKSHYVCNGCSKLFQEILADGESVLAEATEDEITIPAHGHEWGEWTQTKAPTETEEGVLTRTCMICEEATETLSVPMLTHTHGLVHVEAKAATCTQAGNREYWICSEGANPCNCYFADAEGKRQCSWEDIEISPAPHRWSYPTYSEESTDNETCNVTSTWNCENEGCTATKSKTVTGTVTITPPTCSSSGTRQVDAMFLEGPYRTLTNLDPLDHDWGEFELTKAATCSAKGEMTSACSRCNETQTKEVDIDPNAHETYLEIEEATDTATCEEPGKATQYEVCSLCNEIVKQKRIVTPLLGHDWGKPAYEWSDDRTEVTATRTCQRSSCGEEETETVKTTTRTLEESSCEAAGTVVYDATFENEEFDTQEAVVEVAALGHEWGQGKVAKEATAAQTGEKIFTCTRCGATKTETIPMLKKAANPLNVKGKTVKVKSKKLKKKSQKLAVTRVIRFTGKGQGKMTYKLSSAKKGKKNYRKYFGINKKTGKVTIKKGLKKGTYKVIVRARANGNTSYAPSAWKKVTFKVKVK